MSPATVLTITHFPRHVRAELVSPGGNRELFIEGPPTVVYAAVADYFQRWVLEGRRVGR